VSQIEITNQGFVGRPSSAQLPKESFLPVVERNLMIDVVRGLAVFGILVGNIFLFGMPLTAISMPYIWADAEVVNVLSWVFAETFIDGSMRALFSILFGASALLILSQPKQLMYSIEPYDIYYRRLLWLMLFGIIHGYLLLWPFDVLFLYGLLGMFLFPLRTLSPRNLITIAAIATITFNVFSNLGLDGLGAQELTENARENTEIGNIVGPEGNALDSDGGTGQELLVQAFTEAWNNEQEQKLQEYPYIFLSTFPMTFEQQSTEVFKFHLFDIGALMLIGMALFKTGVVTGEKSRRFYIWLLVVAYGIGTLINALELYPTIKSGFDLSLDVSWIYPFHDVSRIAMAMGHLSIIALLIKSGRLLRFTLLLAANGRMALTNYVMQTIICLFLFYGFGLGFYGTFNHYELLLIAVLIGTLQMFASKIYLGRFKHGPLEQFLRKLVASNNRKKQSVISSV